MPEAAAARALAVVATLVVASVAEAQTRFDPGWNLFSVEQDVQVGRQAEQAVRADLKLEKDPRVTAFVAELGNRLAAVAPGHDFPYEFHVVDSPDINAFALPGGPIYLNDGVIAAAQDEGQVAGVLAHEIAHVALRHGTHAASKAYVAQAGWGLLGELIGRDEMESDLAQFVSGFGTNLLFLRYSRDAESEADAIGVQILARAGHSPEDMISFFELLDSVDRRRTVEWLSSHPSPGDRARRVRQEAASVDARTGTRPSSRSFVEARAALTGQRAPLPGTARATRRGEGRAVAVRIEPPSRTFTTLRAPSGLFSIRRPANWDVHGSSADGGITVAPPGGLVTEGGRVQVIEGLILGHRVPRARPVRGNALRRGRPSADQASRELVQSVLDGNPHLGVLSGTASRARTRDGGTALTVAMAGDPPGPRARERVDVVTRQLDDGHLLYLVFVSPGENEAELAAVRQRVIASLSVDESARH